MGDYLMSLIKANDIQNASGGIPTVKSQQLIPTAWVNFNGTGTVAIRDSEGVSSITDNGTGDYTINFSTPMADTNFSALLSMGHTTAYNAGYLLVIRETSTYRTTSLIRTLCNNGHNGNTPYSSDADIASIQIMGGQ